MIKFAKYMYSLGYDSAVREMLGTIDAIPFTELSANRGKSITINHERKMFKSYMHEKFDKDYKPTLDKDLLRREI